MAANPAGAVTAACRTEPGDPGPATDMTGRRPTTGSAEMSMSWARISIHAVAYSFALFSIVAGDDYAVFPAVLMGNQAG
jgi:hypothetical protein